MSLSDLSNSDVVNDVSVPSSARPEISMETPALTTRFHDSKAKMNLQEDTANEFNISELIIKLRRTLPESNWTELIPRNSQKRVAIFEEKVNCN